MNEAQQTGSRNWTLIGLVIALVGLPMIVWAYRLIVAVTTDASQLLVREATVFGLLGALFWIIVSKEALPLTSIGLRFDRWGSTLLWGLLGMFLCGLGFALSLGIIQLLKIPYGGGGSGFVPPLAMTILIMLRAGIVEEVFYRGYAYERLLALSHRKSVAVLVPLAAFALSHASQGVGGILVAFVLGGVLTGLYLWKRNLSANIVAHFLVDFFPNVVLPMLGADN